MTVHHEQEVDLFDPATLADPYPTYARFRYQGGVAHFASRGYYGLFDHDTVLDAGRDWELFSSAQGVALNDASNLALEGTAIASDPPEHVPLRRVFGQALSVQALLPLREPVRAAAELTISKLPRGRAVDVVRDLAQTFPAHVMAEAFGLPESGRDELLRYAEGTSDAFGPDSDRTTSGLQAFGQMYEYMAQQLTADRLAAEGLASRVYAAAAEGHIAPESCLPILSGFVAAGFDTTASAIESALLLFATHPDQWALLVAEPERISAAVQEVLRLYAPVQFFARTTTRDVALRGIDIPAGARVALYFASACRDERHYGPTAEQFDITRTGDNLAFGVGRHQCPGAGLAELQVAAILGAILEQGLSLRYVTHQVGVNNNLRKLARLEIEFS